MDLDLSNSIKIGAGSHWTVYRPGLDVSINIDGMTHSHIVYKISNEGKGNVDKNIETYSKVKSANLPTLKLYSSYRTDSIECIIAEDLNPTGTEIIYVSPNTGRNLPSPISIIIDHHLNIILENDHEPLIECAEVNLKENKLTTIKNFDLFINTIYQDMKNATIWGLGLCEDAFFYGIKPSDGNIQYKIADFDTIITSDIPNTKEVTKRNTRTFLNSFWEFFDQFVDESIAGEYKSRIEEILKGLN